MSASIGREALIPSNSVAVRASKVFASPKAAGSIAMIRLPRFLVSSCRISRTGQRTGQNFDHQRKAGTFCSAEREDCAA